MILILKICSINCLHLHDTTLIKFIFNEESESEFGKMNKFKYFLYLLVLLLLFLFDFDAYHTYDLFVDEISIDMVYGCMMYG